MGILSRLFGRAGGEGDKGGDGSSAEKAVIVGSVREEYAWIHRHCPGYDFDSQTLKKIEGKMYDVLTLHNAAGEEREVYFDISRFYGKM